MKPLFTYPNNPGSNFINPDYLGNTTSGLTGRFEDLLDGTFKAWQGLSPTINSTNALQMGSRFVNYFDHFKTSDNLRIYDFWEQPLVIATLGLIDNVEVSSVAYSAGPPETTIITTTTNHDFDDGDLVVIDNFDLQMAVYNGNSYYVDSLSNTTLQLYNDSALTDPLIVGANIQGETTTALWSANSTTQSGNNGKQSPAFIYEKQLEGYTANGPLTYIRPGLIIDTSSFVAGTGSDPMVDLPDGTGVRINSVSYNGTGLEGNTYTTTKIAPDTYELNIDVDNITGFPNTVNGRITVDFDQASQSSNITGRYNSVWVFETENALPKDGGQVSPAVKVITNNDFDLPSNNWRKTFNVQNRDNRLVDQTYVRIGATDATTYPNKPVKDQVWGTNQDGSYYYASSPSPSRTDYPEAPLYYSFNKYNDLEFDTNGVVTMTTASSNPGNVGVPGYGNYALNADPTQFIAQPWSYDALEEGHWSIFRMGQHCVKLFNGMTFTTVTRESTFNQPLTLTINSQPGKPVIDDVDAVMYQYPTSSGFSTNSKLRIASQRPPTSSNQPINYHVTGWYDMQKESQDGLGDMNIVLWNPTLSNLDSARSPWEEYSNLNLMSRSTPGGSYDTDEWGTVKWNGATQSWDTYNPGAKGLIVKINYNNHDNLNQYVNKVYAPDTTGTTNIDITLDAINAFFGTSYTDGSTIDIKISACPWDLGGMTAHHSFNMTYGFAKGAWYQSPFNNSEAFSEYDIPLINTHVGTGIQHDIAQGGRPGYTWNPNLFILNNEIEVAPLSMGTVDADYFLAGQTVATQGDLALDAGSAFRYEAKQVDIYFPGNKTYYHYDSNGDYVPGARIDTTEYWAAGQTTSRSITDSGETQCNVTITVDTNGRLSGATLVQGPGSEGSYSDGGYIALPLLAAADVNPPADPTPIELADTWDTQDDWTSPGSGTKEWPRHVSPSSAKIDLLSPTVVNNSQNGFKYSRKGGFTKWALEVTYPPMTAEDFAEFHGVAQAAQGQAIPFSFILQDKNGNPLLWKNFNNLNLTDQVSIKTPTVNAGDSTMLLEGFSYNEQNALVAGQVIQIFGAENQNGKLYTVINDVDANVYGEAKIRISHPMRSAASAGQNILTKANRAIVTLADDGFQYSVGTDGYYRMSVTFDLDDWKT